LPVLRHGDDLGVAVRLRAVDASATTGAERSIRKVGGAAAEAVTDRVGFPHATAPTPVISLFEERVQLQDATIRVGDELCATGDELVAEHLAPIQVQREAPQMVDRLLALVPQALAFASQLAHGRRPLGVRRRLGFGGFGGFVDINRSRRNRIRAGVVTD
jgi:hypothetical protein